MLRGLLNQNKHAIAFGELFRFNDSIGWDYPGHNSKDESDLLLINREPIRFLKEKVFIEFPSQIKAVGFKMFYFHAQSENWRPVWTYLQEQKTFKIIHIKRNNVLKTYLSHTRALQTDTWINKKNKVEDQPPIVLEYEKTLHYFKKVEEYEKKYDDYFKHHDRLELIYETLAASYQDEVERVFAFLGVPGGEEVKPVTFRQAMKPLHQCIANYSMLKNKFRATPWEKYFEE
jgi:hypothetical protein